MNMPGQVTSVFTHYILHQRSSRGFKRRTPVSKVSVMQQMRNGLIYHHWTPPGRDDESMFVEQLVLPSACRQDVQRISVPLAGHPGQNKPTQRLLSRFCWPTLHKDFCRRCEQCQRAPATFQCLMDRLFLGQDHYTTAYPDDLVV